MLLDSAGMPQQGPEVVALWFGVQQTWSVGLHPLFEREHRLDLKFLCSIS
jgi:hypothetical protein